LRREVHPGASSARRHCSWPLAKLASHLNKVFCEHHSRRAAFTFRRGVNHLHLKHWYFRTPAISDLAPQLRCCSLLLSLISFIMEYSQTLLYFPLNNDANRSPASGRML